MLAVLKVLSLAVMLQAGSALSNYVHLSRWESGRGSGPVQVYTSVFTVTGLSLLFICLLYHHMCCDFVTKNYILKQLYKAYSNIVL